MRNFIANIPLVLGAGLQRVVTALFDLSLKLHLTLNTEIGIKVKSIQTELAIMAEAYKNLGQQAGTNVQRQQPQSKLASLIQGNGDGTKKPTDS